MKNKALCLTRGFTLWERNNEHIIITQHTKRLKRGMQDVELVGIGEVTPW